MVAITYLTNSSGIQLVWVMGESRTVAPQSENIQ